MSSEPKPDRTIWLAVSGAVFVLAAAFVAIAVGFLTTSKPFDFWGSWEMIVAYVLAIIGVLCFAAAAGDVPFPLTQDRVRIESWVRAPVAPVGMIDPTKIGVDVAAQRILPGGDVPEYLPRKAGGGDERLRAAVRAAVASTGSWLVVVAGSSKTGKSRTLFEAL